MMLYLSALVLFLYLFFRMVLLSGLSRAGKAAAGTFFSPHRNIF